MRHHHRRASSAMPARQRAFAVCVPTDYVHRELSTSTDSYRGQVPLASTGSVWLGDGPPAVALPVSSRLFGVLVVICGVDGSAPARPSRPGLGAVRPTTTCLLPPATRGARRRSRGWPGR